MKEQLRAIIEVKGKRAVWRLSAWLAWASRYRIDAFVELGPRSVRTLRALRPRCSRTGRTR